MLIDNEIEIILNNRYIKYYKDKGYNTDGVKSLIIKIYDLPKSSHYNVKVKCDNCENEKKIKYYNYVINFEKKGKYVCNDCKIETITNSNLEKYGVKSTLELDSVKEKSKKTMIKKYGVEHYSKTEKFKKLNIEKYGVKSTLELDYVKEKSKITMNDRYGVDYYSKSKEYIKKINNTCNKKYGVNHYSKTTEFKEKIKKQVIKNKNIKTNINIIDYENNIFKVNCEKQHVFIIDRITLKNRIKYKTEICTICNPIGSFSNSGYEKQFNSFINKYYNGILLHNKRNIISPLELDIYIPELKLAFEFNGLFWHNEINKENNYHLNKTEECEKQGIQLIHIWEDDWIYKQDIIKSIILNKLGKSDKIYARKTTIKEIDNNKLIRDFLDKNHIQGFIGSKVKIGLFHNDELVSLMTFGNRRVSMGKKSTNEGEYELLRFCNKLNTNVVGGASKLFKYFIDVYNPIEIITYADRSFSQGELYKQLTFNYICKTEPNYYYIIDGIRHHRFNFRKDKLIKDGFEPNKTEHEIMLERKIYRIYDSGNLKFIYNKK